MKTCSTFDFEPNLSISVDNRLRWHILYCSSVLNFWIIFLSRLNSMPQINNTFHELCPVVCSDSELMSEAMNSFIIFLYDSDGASAHHNASIYTGQRNTKKRRHISMPRAGFEHTIPMFQRSITVRAWDLMVIGTVNVMHQVSFYNSL
jgi:hypothetical protein